MMVLTQGCLPRLAELLNKVSTKALTAFILLVILQVSWALHKVAQDNNHNDQDNNHDHQDDNHDDQDDNHDQNDNHGDQNDNVHLLFRF